jgi:hypothetical protein
MLSRWVAGVMSNWIDLDSEDDATRDVSEKAFIQQLSWAAYLSLPVSPGGLFLLC